MGNAECRQNTGRSCSEDDSPALSFDENFPNYNETTINRGTIVSPKPQLKFHSICGTNIVLLRDGRVAKRRESFCKGLAFSNRPIGIGEIVCIRLCEVGNNWSGVMRFGVTNVDPASFRDIELPKFACPDLTSKGGYWAKSLAERFSVQGLILHFFINDSGEMHYGVNGVHKGLFLSGINVNSPLWTIVDIYGNSVAVEFVDARLRFHSVKGNNVVIQNNGTTAVRKHGEYYLGYVFTERPIRIGEKIVILVSMTEDAFSGSLAFGLTSCDPDQVPAARLPADSDELLERPEYWVCIKDVGASPQVGTTLNFKVDCTGRVLFSKNDAPFRVIMHVDVSIPLWAFFDLYGSTRKIQILDLDQPLSPAEYIAMRGHRASSEGAASAHGDSNDTSLYISPTTRLSRPSSAQWNMESLRVALPEPLSITPPTQSTAVSTTTNSTSALSETTTSAPSFSAPSYSLHEPRDLTNLRVANTLRRLNQQQADLLAEANSSINLASTTTTTSAAAISSSTNSPSAYSTPLFSSPYTSTLLGGGGNNSTNNSESSSQAVNDFINNYRQIQRERMQNHSRSPVRPINNNQRGNNSNNAAANLFEFPNAPTTTNSGASITVPLLPAPLFSSLNVPSNEQQNLRNRAAEFEAALSSSLSSDHSPNRRSLLEGNRQSSGEGGTTTAVNNNNNDADAAIQLEDGDRNNECTICMTNRVNAVIYRCGHMCMCFPCAKETHRRSGDCPICRTPIIDVIRCYPV